MELLGHHWLNLLTPGDTCEFDQRFERARAIERLSSDVLIDQTRLLTERRGHHYYGVRGSRGDNVSNYTIHLLITVPDCVLILGLVGVGRFDLEWFRIHVPPVRVLEMSRAVQKKRGERRAKLFEVRQEHVTLELVENRGALPFPFARASFAPQLADDRSDRAGRQSMRRHELQETQIIALREWHTVVGVFLDVSLNEQVVRFQFRGERTHADRPWIRDDRPSQRHIVLDVHAPTD